jgi:hypothetical protein
MIIFFIYWASNGESTAESTQIEKNSLKCVCVYVNNINEPIAIAIDLLNFFSPPPHPPSAGSLMSAPLSLFLSGLNVYAHLLSNCERKSFDGVA